MKSDKYHIENPHSHSIPELCELLDSDTKTGITGSQAEERLRECGKNVIEGEQKQRIFLIFLSQFKSPMVILLAVAGGLSFFFQEWLDGVAILAVIFINAVIGFVMEYQAERSMNALKRMSQVNAKISRDKILQEISAEEIVPGDVLFAEAGDMILADARIYHASQLQMNESALTGESVPIEKGAACLEKETFLPDRTNMLYKGTFVTKGNARALVTGTGMDTELGKIASMVQSAEQAITPLEKKLEGFSKKLIKITLALVVVIFIAGILNGQGILEMLKTVIALAVAAIPEGLPIVATLALAQGTLKMARHNVIIKKLSAVETLGGTNVICTDKTGTLTQNKIQVSIIITPEEKTEVIIDLNIRKPKSIRKSHELMKNISVLCNTAELNFNDNGIKEVGDPLETGLLLFAYSEGMEIEQFRKQNPIIKEEPFSSETKIMATLHRDGDGYFIAAKGAVEELVNKCAISQSEKTKWLSEADNLAKSGLRVIALAYRQSNIEPQELAAELVLAGLVGMLDPPREEVYAAINECKTAGINVVMVTGDHPYTANNIAQKLGLFNSESEIVVHGKEMPEYVNLSEEVKNRWINAKVFARVSPKQKLDLVKVFQEKHFVVAMTGDGVNDAPALKKADIGIAMGKRGTQVAQEVADMILKDDSFSSIVLAIKQGRVIFDNIRKFVIYLLSCNMSELFVVSIASVLNLHFQLLPLQILFINLVTDILPALALGITRGSGQIMKQPPRNENEPILDNKRWISVIAYATIITGSTIGAVFFSHLTIHKMETWNSELCNNILFYTLIFSQLLHVFNMSSAKKAFWKTNVFKNKYIWLALMICILISLLSYFILPIRNILSIQEMTREDWFIIAGFGFLSLIIIQLMKKLKLIL